MNTLVAFDQLVVECGRMCNMQCLHCLRGDSQNRELPLETIKQFFSQVSYIGSLTFSGGEPMLYGNIINAIVNEIISRNIPVGHFYMATNGKCVDMSVLGALLRFRAYCEEPDLCTLDLSLDEYHEEIPAQNRELLAGLSFFSTRGEQMTDRWFISEGRAQENGIGGRTIDDDPRPFKWEDRDVDLFVEDTTYLNVFGELFPECDFSYDTQAIYAAWNIFDHSVNEIITKFACAEELAA